MLASTYIQVHTHFLSQPKAPIHLDIIVSYIQVPTHFLSQSKAPINLDISLIHTGPHPFLITTQGHYPFGYLLSHMRQPRLLHNNTKLLIILNVALFREPGAKQLPRLTPFTRSCNQFLNINIRWWSFLSSALFWCNTCLVCFIPKIIASEHHMWQHGNQKCLFPNKSGHCYDNELPIPEFIKSTVLSLPLHKVSAYARTEELHICFLFAAHGHVVQKNSNVQSREAPLRER